MLFEEAGVKRLLPPPFFGWPFAEASWELIAFAKQRDRAMRFRLPRILDWTKGTSQRQDKTRT